MKDKNKKNLLNKKSEIVYSSNKTLNKQSKEWKECMHCLTPTRPRFRPQTFKQLIFRNMFMFWCDMSLSHRVFQKKTILCLTSCSIRTVKCYRTEISSIAFRKGYKTFDIKHLNFRAILTKIEVFNLAGRFENWWVNDKNRIIKLIRKKLPFDMRYLRRQFPGRIMGKRGDW